MSDALMAHARDEWSKAMIAAVEEEFFGSIQLVAVHPMPHPPPTDEQVATARRAGAICYLIVIGGGPPPKPSDVRPVLTTIWDRPWKRLKAKRPARRSTPRSKSR